MAKISDRQKDNIIALFKTGQYTKRGLAKKYKVAETTIRRIVADVAPTNSHIVEKGVELEKEKSRISVAEQRAVEVAVKEKTKEERMKEVVLDNVLKISVHTTTASAKLLQDNSTSKNKMDGNELLTVQRVAKEAKATVVDKKEKNSTNIQMTQMMSQQEEVITETIVITDNKDMLEKMGLL